MIQRLQIHGFKSFGFGGVDIPMAPITILLGENSVGKSSVFQAMLALQQSWGTLGGIGQFCPVGPGIDLGRFSSLQHRMGDYVNSEVRIRMETEGLTLGASWAGHGQLEIPSEEANVAEPPSGWPDWWRKFESVDQGVLTRLEVDRFFFLASVEPHTSRLILTLSHDSVCEWLRECPDGVLENAVNEGAYLYWVLDPGSESLEPSVGVPDLPHLRIRDEDHYQQAIEAVSLLREDLAAGDQDRLWARVNSVLAKLGNIRRTVSYLCHLGGIRERGRRIYDIMVHDAPWNIGSTGRRIADLLTQHPDAEERTNRLLQAMDAGYRVSLEDPPTFAQLREVILEDLRVGPGAGNFVNLPDVGTGISQLLPIAVQIAVFMDRRVFDTEPLLMIEQPELHLHPRLQAKLSEMLADTVTLEVERGADSAVGRNVQFLIETHSEHLVRALAVLIEQGRLTPDMVSLVQLDRDPETGGVQAHRVRFTEDGRFLDIWPRGFFPERDRLLDGHLV